jgi:hypothetical protein
MPEYTEGWLKAKEDYKDTAAVERWRPEQEMRSNFQNTSRETFFKCIRNKKTGKCLC